MPEPLYDLFYSGKLMEGLDAEEVRGNLARMFKADEAMLNRLFSGTPVRVKGGIDQETAIKYRVAFRDAGALVDIRPCTGTAVEKQPLPSETGEMSLLPPHTGTLADCAVEKEPADIPDTSRITLAPTGSELDMTPPPATADIDTHGLSLNPANSGSLEDCHIEPEPAEIPDISGLKLDDFDA
ncbi:MAG: hypothetical protein ABW168_26475 [Sedimenticola sp.]